MARKSLTKKMLPNWPVPFLNFGQFWAAFQNFGHHLDRSTKTAPTPHLDRPDSDPLCPCPGPLTPLPPPTLKTKSGQSWCWPKLVLAKLGLAKLRETTWPNFVWPKLVSPKLVSPACWSVVQTPKAWRARCGSINCREAFPLGTRSFLRDPRDRDRRHC